MGLPALYPQPQLIEEGQGRVSLARQGSRLCTIILAPDASALEQTAAEVIKSAIFANAGWAPTITEQPVPGTVPILIGEEARSALDQAALPQPGNLSDESYILQIKPEGIALRGLGGQGTLYAAQTLAQLITRSGAHTSVPEVTIRDWPQLLHRGLYLESKWGPDLMQLHDWQELIDYMASIKMNLLGVGIYGCWNMQYDNRITEFLMVPIKQKPDLKTEKSITYYSAKHGKWEMKSYLPAMFRDDFFGEVIAYGRRHGVVVRPHFNSLGHNTLIPRLYPEISARDKNGWPTGYGFCLSNPKTLQTMDAIFEEITSRYLLPNGVDYFHLGLDEVWVEKGIFPHHPQRQVSPWCECPQCRQQDQKELMIKYIVGLISSLREKGMRHISLWHDQLERMDAHAEFAQRVEEQGLKDNVVVQWWHYGHSPFKSIHPELGLRRFVTPMAGYYFWSATDNYLENIRLMNQLGKEQGAEGIEAYCTYDKGFDHHYRFLAEAGWNDQSISTTAAWQEKYSQFLFGDEWKEGLSALNALTAVSTGTEQSLVAQLDAYRYTYVDVEKEYPRSYPEEILVKLRQDKAKVAKLTEIAATAHTARSGLARLLHKNIPHRDLTEQFLAEAWRIEALVSIFRNLLQIEEQHQAAVAEKNVSAAREKIHACHLLAKEAIEWHDSAAFQLESAKADYLLPQTLRNWSSIRPFLANLEAVLASHLDAKSSEEADLPPLPLPYKSPA